MTRGLTTFMVLLSSAAFAQLVPYTDETTGVGGRTLGDPAIITTPGAEAVVATDSMVGGAWAWYLPLDGGTPQSLTVGPVRGADFRRFAKIGDYTVIPAFTAGRFYAFHPDGGAAGPQLYECSASTFVLGTPTAVALADRPSADATPVPTVYAADTTNQVKVFSAQLDVLGHFTGTVAPSIVLSFAPEGLVSDDRHGVLYVSTPVGGLFAADETTQFVSNLDTNTGPTGNLKGQPAGLAFYPLQDGGGLLLAAVPSHDDVAVYAITSGTSATYVGRFGVGLPGPAGPVVRAAHFLDVTPHALPGFPRGLLVIADQSTSASPNYKLVPWERVAAAVGLPVEVVTFDAGASADGGATDGGVPDGGTGGGAGGSGGHIGPTGPGEDPPPRCGCAGGPAFLLFPGVLLLLARFPRRRRTT